MDKKDLSNIGDDIKNIVQNAVSTRDFHQLNRDIGNTVNGALEEVRRAIGLHDGRNFRGDRNSNPNQWSNRSFTDQHGNQGGPGYGNQGGPQYGNQTGSRSTNQNKNQGSFYAGNPNDIRNRNRFNSRTGSQNEYSYSNNPDLRGSLVPCVPVGRVSGLVLSFLGGLGTGAFGIAMFVLGIVGYFSQEFYVFLAIIFGLSPLLLGSMVMLSKGNKIRKRFARFRRYVGLFHGRNYCSIKELCDHIGQSKKFVVKDLRNMIAVGMFPQGHIDEKQTCLMLNSESYEQYLLAQDSMQNRSRGEQEAQSNQQGKQEEKSGREKTNASNEHNQGKEDILSKELRAAIDDGKNYITQIKEVNDAIPGEEISRKLDHLEKVTSKIFGYVEYHPEQFPEIRKFMDYYLPTTLKLLNAYKEFDNQPVQGDNITSAKNEIEKTLDTINMAFENLFDSLFEDAAIDVSTDISVLKTILAQEGLTKKDFDNKSL